MSVGEDLTADNRTNPAAKLSEAGNILLLSCAGTVLLWFGAYAAVRIAGHSERLEWIAYEVASVGAALTFWLSALVLRRHPLSGLTTQIFSVILMIAAALAAVLLLCKGAMPPLLAVPLGLVMIPLMDIVRSRANALLPKPELNPVLLILVNALALLAAVSLFTIDLEITGALFGYPWLCGAVWGLGLFLVMRRALRAGDNGDCLAAANGSLLPARSLAGKAAVLVGVLLILSFLNLHTYEYNHSRNYVGAIFDVWNGKSLIYDTPSFYGFLNMHILSWVLGPLGISFETFTCADSVLVALWQIAGACVLFRLWPWARTRVFAAVVFVLLPTLLTVDNGMSPYSTGPLRFGLGLAVCWALVCLPRRAGFWTGTFLSAIAAFWSGETAVYVVPAWVFCCVADAMRSPGGLVPRIRSAGGSLLVFAGVCAAVAGCVFWSEYRPGRGFPLYDALFQYAALMPSGSLVTTLITSMKMDAFGNHYFLVAIFMLGLALMTAMFANRLASPWFRPLAFMAIHNVACFAHFVGHSDHEYGFDLVGFAFIEFALAYRILHEDYGVSRLTLRRCFEVPILVLCTMLMLRPVCCPLIPLSWAMQVHDGARQAYDSLARPAEDTPLLRKAVEKFAGDGCQVAVICDRSDTRLLVEANVINALCLNPFYNLGVLPDGVPRFVEPAVAQMRSGTLLLVDRFYLETEGRRPFWEDEVTRAILERIRARFSLEELGVMRDCHPGLDLQSTDLPYVDLAVFRLNALPETSRTSGPAG